MAMLVRMKQYLFMVLICIFLMVSGIKCIFIYLIWRNVFSDPLSVVWPLWLSFRSSLYVLDVKILSDM